MLPYPLTLVLIDSIARIIGIEDLSLPAERPGRFRFIKLRLYLHKSFFPFSSTTIPL
jgi:hypothetical protein